MGEHTEQPRAIDETRAADRTEGDRFFTCEQCGAELTYTPGTTTLECDYCNHANEIPESTEVIEELDFRAHLAALQAGADTDEHRTVECDSSVCARRLRAAHWLKHGSPAQT